MLECVVNLSEGRDASLLAAFRTATAGVLLDAQADPHLNRSVLTLAAEGDELHDAVCGLTRLAVSSLDLGGHSGAHPRLGVVDVVPFVDLSEPTAPATARSLSARDRFADWAATTLGLPCFLYGPERSLPDIRREAWRGLGPDRGPPQPHPTAGAACVGARGVLVAYNLVLRTDDLALARRVAARVRRPGLRALGFAVGARVEVSCNLTDPHRLGPADAYDVVAAAVALEAGAGEAGAFAAGAAAIAAAELVGLLPEAVLAAVPSDRWAALGIGPDRTIETALARPRSW